MIARHWRGWTEIQNGDAYEKLLKEKVLPLFAGPEYSVPVFEPEAKLLLSRIEPVAMHYDVRAVTVGLGNIPQLP
jgi:hypothetical protein